MEEVMAISKAMQTALRALSYPELDIRRTYRLEREVKRIGGKLAPTVGHSIHTVDTCFCFSSHIVPLRIYHPSENIPTVSPILLFIHGGGWVMGCIDSYDSVCRRLACFTGCTVISVEYRLAPENPYPAGLEDCYLVTKSLLEGRIFSGSRKRPVILIGDSAGGNLAAAVSLLARDQGEPFPAGQVLIYPALFYDYSSKNPYPSVRDNGSDYLLTAKRMQEFIEMYQGDKTEFSPYFSPLLAEDFSNQPPTLIITAEFCPLRDEGEDYADKLGAAGATVKLCRVPDALHNFFCLSEKFPAVQLCYEEICTFLTENFHVSCPEPDWRLPK
jgi:acetyl esterase/lipase